MLVRFVVTAIILTLVVTASWFFIPEVEGFRLWLFTAFAAAAYLIFSFRFTETVKPGTNAVILRFGKAVDEVKGGLPFAPLGIYTLKVISMTQQQREIPGEPSEVWNGPITELPEGKIPALRIAFRDAISDDEAQRVFGDEYIVQVEQDDGTKRDLRFVADVPEDGMSRRVTTEITAVYVWLVTEPTVLLQQFDNPIDNVNKQLEDELFQICEAQLPKMSLSQALVNKRWINAQLLKAANRRSHGWGIKIVAAYLKNLPIHHGLNSAIGDASEAEFRGRARRELLQQEGLGAAKAAQVLEHGKIRGRGQGLRDAAKATGLTPAEIQAAEVARGLATSGSTVVVGTEGISQLLGAAAAAAQHKKKEEDKQ